MVINERRLCWWSAAATSGAAVAMSDWVGLSIDWRSFTPFAVFAVCVLCLLAYVIKRRLVLLKAPLELLFLSTLIGVPILVLSFCAMRLNFSLADNEFADADTLMGFSSRSLISAVGKNVLLANALELSYRSFAIQLLLIPFWLSLTGSIERAYLFITSFIVLCLIAIAVAIFLPALGTYRHFGLTASDLGHISPHFGTCFLPALEAVRSDPGFVLTFGTSSGIIAFPSVHAATAVLCAWAMSASAKLGPLMLVVNVFMFVSAVTHGAHYLVDVLAGLLVAIAAIGIVTRSCQKRAFNSSARPAGRAAVA